MGKRKRTKKSRKASSLFVRAFLLVFVCTVAVGIGKQAIRYQELQEELAVVTAEIEEEQEKQLNFETRREFYHSDTYIEQVAREQLGCHAFFLGIWKIPGLRRSFHDLFWIEIINYTAIGRYIICYRLPRGHQVHL